MVGLPHTRFIPEYSWCAYTGKVARFAQMMDPVADVVTYGNGPEGEDLPGEYVMVTDATFDPFFIPQFEADNEWFATFNSRATAAIVERLGEDDLVLLIGGRAQEPIAFASPNRKVVEFGVGYEGVFATYKVFESYAWQHFIYGKYGWWGGDNDAVIPNYFDAEDFTQSEDRDYFAFLGRVDYSKGVDIAIEAARRAGVKLKIAGHIFDNSDYVRHLSGDIEYVGELAPTERRDFLAHAKAVICPTRFVEPFCGVHVEAMLSGAWVIAPEMGVFTETIEPRRQGILCRNLGDYVDAIAEMEVKDWWSREHERTRLAFEARCRYSLDAVRPRYVSYLDRVAAS